ncbi:MAG TPA: hypothetical protein VHZ51_27275 [Ktedonobacteraceae bacterium]|nr:hypothetical protein [Ktedonobacteraceae bacterium]
MKQVRLVGVTFPTRLFVVDAIGLWWSAGLCRRSSAPGKADNDHFPDAGGKCPTK